MAVFPQSKDSGDFHPAAVQPVHHHCSDANRHRSASGYSGYRYPAYLDRSCWEHTARPLRLPYIQSPLLIPESSRRFDNMHEF